MTIVTFIIVLVSGNQKLTLTFFFFPVSFDLA